MADNGCDINETGDILVSKAMLPLALRFGYHVKRHTDSWTCVLPYTVLISHTAAGPTCERVPYDRERAPTDLEDVDLVPKSGRTHAERRQPPNRMPNRPLRHYVGDIYHGRCRHGIGFTTRSTRSKRALNRENLLGGTQIYIFLHCFFWYGAGQLVATKICVVPARLRKLPWGIL